tara:strand:+ start:632 stop:1144 length:513 start_codon:yes stop_codon:yes gene_type:complete
MSTLKVGTIQDHANSITAMTIDSAGRVLQPAKPSFFAHMTGGNWVDNVADDAVLPFNATLHNTGNHYNTSTYKFTVPITGVYFFSFQLYLSNGGGAQYAGIGKNNTLLNTGNGDNYPLIGIYQNTGAPDYTKTASGTLSLSAGDTIDVRNIGSTTDYFQAMCQFHGFLIG